MRRLPSRGCHTGLMTVPAPWLERLRLPVIAAPMFLVSGTALVAASCRSGIVGSFPALNCRTSHELDAWLQELSSVRAPADAPCAVNLVVHGSNRRLESDVAVLVEHRVPVVITSLGAVSEVVDVVHAYGGIVFHDVTTVRHATKAAEAGVDGLICVAAGAGGHAGTLSPFALLAEVRRVFRGTLVLAGGIATGADILAARVMGADLVSMGTRFLATQESAATAAHKAMVLQASAEDVVYTDRVSGVPANFLRASLAAAGMDGEEREMAGPVDLSSEARAWRDIWSAGHSVAGVTDVPSVAMLVDRLAEECEAARHRL